MAEFQFGPAEIIVAQLDSERPTPGVVQAILDLIDSDTVRLLDLLFVSRAEDGTTTIIELEEIGEEIGMAEVALEASGLAAEDDVQAMAELIELGSSGAILVIEHVWAKDLASRFFHAGGVVVHSERIPAPVINAALVGQGETGSASAAG
ncbi:MAG TPA: DUF6325 family protein [Leifsonia sp.]|jgi:hypothetical protein|nr:DUF6325 family protein [Leifsonia sp.]